MQLTRIDTAKLKAALAKAEKKVEEAHSEVLAYTVLLTDVVRAETLRARDGFEAAGRKLAVEITARPKLVNATSNFNFRLRAVNMKEEKKREKESRRG